MSGLPASADVDRFRELVGDFLGLKLDDSGAYPLAEVLARRLERSALSCAAYLERLESGVSLREELPELARELTVGETYFFRNPDQFRAFAQLALTEPAASRAPARPLRILSAGCASGEEPYSIAILLAQKGELTRPAVRAVDVNPAALARAGRARYSSWALRETPEAIRQTWFRQDGKHFVLDDGLRQLVRFEARNLAEADPDLWPPAAYDFVFCRNVLMYFTPERAHAVVERIESSLTPGGYLFLGHAETLRGLSRAFDLLHTHDTFYYRRRTGARSVSATVRAPEPPAALLGAATWIEAIQSASNRIQVLAHSTMHSAGTTTDPEREAAGHESGDLGSVLALVQAERFKEALVLVESRPGQADLLLLRATLLAHNGRMAEAEQACHDLLRTDDLNAGAHYLLALCCEARGDPVGARHHDQLAAHLDGSFAMPRLHQGLLSRRAGDSEAARHDLAAALELLRQEDAARLLMFGGGFNRETLEALCQAELEACTRNA